MEENNVVELKVEPQIETKEELSKEEAIKVFTRIIDESKFVADNHLSKEEGGRRFMAVIIDICKMLGADDIDENEFDDPDGIVILEETMDFLVRLRQRLSATCLEEIDEILSKMVNMTE